MIRYWFGRARLAGAFTILPLGLVFQIGGCAINLKTHYNSHPTTVSVSGYYRKDGSYIHAYNRRPPGEAQYDAPFEQAAAYKKFASGLASILGGIAVIVVSCRLFGASDWDLLPALKYPTKLPEKPRQIDVPSQTARARQWWACARCGTAISPNEAYFYARAGRQQKYCASCQQRFSEKHAAEKPKWLAYEAAVKREAAERMKLRLQQYHRYYGRMPDERTRQNA